MAEWRHRLDIKVEWNQAMEGRITSQELARLIAKKLKALSCYKTEKYGEELREIVSQYESFAGDPSGTTDEFDCIMEQLYNWGDIETKPGWPPYRLCWIGTIT